MFRKKAVQISVVDTAPVATPETRTDADRDESFKYLLKLSLQTVAVSAVTAGATHLVVNYAINAIDKRMTSNQE